jgi:hypothetical protein
MVPVFTENRSIGLAPNSAPAASPRLRRRPSPWPPHRHRIPATESTAQHARSCATSRPISTRFESVTRLRGFSTGSSRIPSDLARRTRPAWQSQTVPALSALLTALPSVSWIRLRSAPTRLLRQPSEEAFHLPRFSAPHGALRPRVAITVTTRKRAWRTRLTITHPEHPPLPPPPGTPHYDTDRALELFTRTATMPATKHDLKTVLIPEKSPVIARAEPSNPLSDLITKTWPLRESWRSKMAKT